MNHMLPKVIGLPGIVAILGSHCFADEKKEVGKKTGEPIAKVVWLEVEKAGKLPKSASIDKDTEHRDVLKIVRTPDVPQLIELATIEKFAVTKRAYMLRGKVKFAGVGGEGFLETWSHFPEPKKGAYFSRTMAETGPMGKLRGDSPWKDFVLPFTFDDPSFPMPEKIQFNVYLPQNGTVWLSDLELIEFPPSELANQLSGSSAPSLIKWGMITLGITAILAIASGIAAANLIYLKSKQAQKIELRRMQALDIG